MQVSDITRHLESIAPLSLQESYDNSGLLVGSSNKEVQKILVALDTTEEVLEEAISKKCDLIISHHPVIFKGIKRISENTPTERIISGAIKNDIALYAIHTNLDNVHSGVNQILAEKIGLIKTRILSPRKGFLRKLVTFCPVADIDLVRGALFDAGAGHIGNYDQLQFQQPWERHLSGI